MYKIVKSDASEHDSVAVLVKDKEIVSVLETERVTKHKHGLFETSDPVVDYFINLYKLNPEEVEIIDTNHMRTVQHHPHHELHALSSYLSSGYESAVCLVIDGIGDQDDGCTIFKAKGSKLYEIKKYPFKYSLGALYNYGASLVYPKARHAEGKLMGLAAFTEPDYEAKPPYKYLEDGSVEVNVPETLLPIDDKMTEHYFSYIKYSNDHLIDDNLYKAKVASTIQHWFTESVINLVKYCKSLFPKEENLILSGGCFLNCETNGIIDNLNLFKNIYCLSAPADNSIAFGAAQAYLSETFDAPMKVDSPYFGPDYSQGEIDYYKEFYLYDTPEGEIKSRVDEIKAIHPYSEEYVIEKLKEDNIIVWFDGGSEYGPRALGHRSFLASPVHKEMFWDLSVKIKQREKYRPLAPIITDSLYDKVFVDEHPENLTQFMLKTVKVKEEWIDKIPAVVHINKTARPQRLIKEVNPVLYSLLEKYYEATGIPCLVNTSLNLQGQPILEDLNDLKSIINPLVQKTSKAVLVVNHKYCLEIGKNE